MHILEQKLTLREELKTSRFFLLLQETAGEHCEQIGLGKAVTGPHELMWVVVRQLVEMERWPEPGESFRLLTWPGDTRHMFYPRFHRLESPDGRLLGQCSALWTLVDRNSRKMISPSAYGLDIKGLVTGMEARLPSAPAKLPADRQAFYTVGPDVLDSNGHMNNTRYYDLAESIFGQEIAGRHLSRAMTEYVAEAREGDRMRLDWGQEGSRFFIAGSAGEDRPFFRMSLEYK